jgi:hypothetical protein
VAGALDSLAQEKVAKDRPPGARAARNNPRVERWKREAADYQVVVESSPEIVPSLRTESALDWSNPIRGDDGVSLLWVADGRPHVFACFFRYKAGRSVEDAHEFHSLATVPVVASLGGRTLWHPRGPGIRPAPIPGVPRPAATAAERLRQMRDLAREFKVSVDLEKGGTKLRILSQPLFRYESKSDGALFAFVMATDPEALLLIDERPGDSGPAWHYAFARMSNHSLAAKRRDLVVWEVPVDTNDTDPAKPYFVRWDVGPRAQPAP